MGSLLSKRTVRMNCEANASKTSSKHRPQFFLFGEHKRTTKSFLMQKIEYSFPLTQLQKLFVEKVLELCHSRSIDSYRSKVTCPTYMLGEFYSVLDDVKTGKIKYMETYFSFRDELISVLEDDFLLDYRRMSKKYFIDLLSGMKDEPQVKSGLAELEHAVYFLVVTNVNYKTSLFNALKIYINSEYKTCETCTKKQSKGEEIRENCEGCKVCCFYEVEKLAGVLISELLNHGWSKDYIYKYVKAKFTQTPDFANSWEEFAEEFSSAVNKEITVVFKLHGAAYKLSKVAEDDLKSVLSEVYLPSFDKITQVDKLNNWLLPRGGHRFMVVKTDALDYQQALKKAKTVLSNLLDLMYLGYSDTDLHVDGFVLLYTLSKPEDANLHPIHYSIDGAFKSNTDTFNELRKKVQLIKDRPYIALEAKDKIETAIRYLRAGSESLELEQKFLNYWIGLENIFSSNHPSERTFHRIVKYFTIAHSISYTKRNITEFHKDIKRVGAIKLLGLENYRDIEYLNDVEVFNKVIALGEKRPLLSQRARLLKSVYFTTTEKRKAHLNKHVKNLERHLVRMYRVRNQLVHEAAIMENIENISGSLRYYLTFILNKMIDFYSDCREKPIKSNLVTMSDFFTHQELVWTNIQEKDLDFYELISVPHSVEFIS